MNGLVKSFPKDYELGISVLKDWRIQRPMRYDNAKQDENISLMNHVDDFIPNFTNLDK